MKVMTMRERNYMRHLKHAHQLRAMMKRRDRLEKVASTRHGKGVAK